MNCPNCSSDKVDKLNTTDSFNKFCYKCGMKFDSNGDSRPMCQMAIVAPNNITRCISTAKFEIHMDEGSYKLCFWHFQTLNVGTNIRIKSWQKL